MVKYVECRVVDCADPPGDCPPAGGTRERAIRPTKGIDQINRTCIRKYYSHMHPSYATGERLNRLV